jgi:adenylate cyclase
MTVERRLAAVFSADAVGYSRLMAEDDVSTLRTLDSHRSIMSGLIRQHGGRVVDAVGDNLLAEFSSAVDAVQCALEVQEQLCTANAELPPQRRMPFRIGVNVGDLIVMGERIAGDGVNVAARLEAQATPGAVAISGSVLEQVAGRLPLEARDRGEMQLKNMPRPVRVYELLAEDASEGTPEPSPERGSPGGHVPGFGGQSAIAILPFRNLGQDEEQEWFADGLTEDLTASLAALRVYPVISRNSSFAYKGRLEDAAQAGRELGAHYIVTGSVRRAGQRVRVNAELSDAFDGRQLWSGRYDRELNDLFEVQDEITAAIAGAVEPALFQSEMLHAIRRAPDNLDAWDCAHRGLWHLYRNTREGVARARAWGRRALELQPDMALGWCLIAFSRMYEVIYQWVTDREEAVSESIHAAEQAVTLDPENPMALTALGFAHSMTGDHARALGVLERAVAANPSSALAYWSLGATLSASGRPDDAIPMVEKAIRLSPRDPLMNEFLFTIASSHFKAGRYEEAIDFCQRSLDLKADQPGAWRVMAAAHALLDHVDEARRALERFKALAPDLRLENLYSVMKPELAERFAKALRLAGWEG